MHSKQTSDKIFLKQNSAKFCNLNLTVIYEGEGTYSTSAQDKSSSIKSPPPAEETTILCEKYFSNCEIGRPTLPFAQL